MPGSSAAPLAAQGPGEGRAQIERLLADQEAAWNRGDGVGWATGFSEDADFINIRGDVFIGRAAIAQQHARIFAGPYKGSHAKVTIRRFVEPAPGVAVIETDHEVKQFASLPPGIAVGSDGVLRTHMKYVAVEREGHWVLIAAQNTAVLPPPPAPPAHPAQ